MKRFQTGDVAWLIIVAGALLYELLADDVLSFATERQCRKHPVLARLVILAVAGHLACVMPAMFDVFSAKNLAHRGVVKGIQTYKGRAAGVCEVSWAKRGAVIGLEAAS